ncbi:M48 family metalloprotease [Parvularcula marina]|nr:M48 family metalloprotease [Parvularcula marina]
MSVMSFRPIFLRLSVCLAALFGWIGIASAQTLLRDAEIEQFLEDYTRPLMEVAGINPEGIEILIVGDPNFNAFAGPGVMGMNTGTILMAETPNEIEGVLAHEVGHLAGAHSVRGPEAYAKASRPAMLSLVLGAAAIAAGAPPEAGFGILGLGQNAAMGTALTYSRGQESAADQAALSYLEAIGHSGRGLMTSFERLSNQLLLSGRDVKPYLQTHPIGLKRVAALNDRASQMQHFGDTDSEEEIFRLHMIQAKITGFMSEPFTTLRKYPLSDQTQPARYARAVAYYRDSRLEKALTEIDRLIVDDPDNPFFEELKGQMLFEHGKVREAVEPHRKSVELAPQYALLKINLARALVALEGDEEVTEGITLLQTALVQEPDNSFAWSELARAYAVKRNEPMAALSHAEALFSVGNTPEAHRFASLARDKLTPGTPEHLRALDIIRASEDDARRARARGGNRR